MTSIRKAVTLNWPDRRKWDGRWIFYSRTWWRIGENGAARFVTTDHLTSLPLCTGVVVCRLQIEGEAALLYSILNESGWDISRPRYFSIASCHRFSSDLALPVFNILLLLCLPKPVISIWIEICHVTWCIFKIKLKNFYYNVILNFIVHLNVIATV